MDAIDNFDIQPRDLLVKLLRPQGPNSSARTFEALVTWNVVNAWPKKWSVSEFNAEQNSIAIETLELNYSYFSLQN